MFYFSYTSIRRIHQGLPLGEVMADETFADLTSDSLSQFFSHFFASGMLV